MEAEWEDACGQDGLSLRALTEAFSEVMGRAGRNAPAGVEQTGLEPTGPENSLYIGEMCPPEQGVSEGVLPESPVSGPLPAEPTEPFEISPLSILEAMLFVGCPDNRPLEPDEAASVMRNVRPEEIPELVRELNRRYASAGCPYYIISQGRGYRMTLRKPYWHLRNRFYARIRETKLSQAAIDVLAIVAYQQPITAEEVHQLRGKPSGHILAHLVQRQLLRLERCQDKNRKAYYYTTDRFLALFGLENLDDLPQTEDVEKR